MRILVAVAVVPFLLIALIGHRSLDPDNLHVDVQPQVGHPVITR